MNACAVIVFAKAPRAGHAKTRLAVALGDEGAAHLAERLLQATVDAAVAAAIGPVQLCVTPDADHPAFAAVQRRHPIAITHHVISGKRPTPGPMRLLMNASRIARRGSPFCMSAPL